MESVRQEAGCVVSAFFCTACSYSLGAFVIFSRMAYDTHRVIDYRWYFLDRCGVGCPVLLGFDFPEPFVFRHFPKDESGRKT